MPDWGIQAPKEISGGGEPGGGAARLAGPVANLTFILSGPQHTVRRDGSKQHETSL